MSRSRYVGLSRNDEKYTPHYAVLPILKYLPNKTIWCPFDTRHSEFVLALQEGGFNVVYSHVKTGQNFSSMSLRSGISLFQTRRSRIKRKYLSDA